VVAEEEEEEDAAATGAAADIVKDARINFVSESGVAQVE
jgi:hypothetical protein